MKKLFRILIMFLCVNVCTCNVRADFVKYYGTPEFLSDGIGVNNICRGISSYEDGRPIIVTAVEGAESTLIEVVDVNAEELLHVFDCGDTGTMWMGCAAPDGMVYCYVGNNLFVYSPDKKTIKDAGTVPTTWSGNSAAVVVGDDGVLYGATGRYGNVYKYKNDKITTVASVPDVLGLGGIAYHSGYLWTGGSYNGATGGCTYFYRINPETGEKTVVKSPVPENISSVGQVYTCGEYLIVQIAGTTIPTHGYFYHVATDTWLENKTIDFKANSMTDVCQNQRFYIPSGSSRYYGINVDTLETKYYSGLGSWSYQRGNGLAFKCDFFSGDCFAQIQYNGNLYVCSPSDNAYKNINVSLEKAKLKRRISRVGSDGRIYVTGFMGSFGIAYDPDTGDKESFNVSQGEGAVEYNNKMYIGSYPSAVITEFDMSLPKGAAGKQKTICDIGDEQDRPFGMDVADGKLLVGTLPVGGKVGGALTLIDTETYEHTTYRNLVPEHGILTVTHKGKIVYCGTTASGGSGIVASEGNRTAHVFAFDLDSRKIIKDVEISIPGVGVNIGAVHGLRISPYNGKLYGTTGGVDFVMNPDTLELEKYHIYSSGYPVIKDNQTQLWHEHYMQFSGGYLFRTDSILDPETLEVMDTVSTGQFAGIYNDMAYFVAENTDIYAVALNKAALNIRGCYWDFDDRKGMPEHFVYNNKSVYTSSPGGVSGKAEDYSFRFISGIGFGRPQNGVISKYSNGFNILQNQIGSQYINNTAVTVSMDFQIKTDLLTAHLINPAFAGDNGNFYGVVSLQNGTLFAAGREIGSCRADEWHNVSAVYRISDTEGLSYDVYYDEKLVAAGLKENNYSIRKGISHFRILIGADPQENLGELNDRYDERNEYLLIDNLYIGYNRDNVGREICFDRTAGGVNVNGGSYGNSATLLLPDYDIGGRLKNVRLQVIDLKPKTTTFVPADTEDFLLWEDLTSMKPVLEGARR